MIYRKYMIIGIAAVVVAATLYSTYAVQDQMQDIIVAEELWDTTPVDQATPGMVILIGLGGFRGLLADGLFLRLQKLHEEENYFEMVQLGEWIVRLQPRFTAAIDYIAWNMAYNISVTFSDCSDRWRWVNAGVDIIRDLGFDNNPDSPLLYQRLGWMYQHKMGQILDNCNRTYRLNLAVDMMRILGSESPDWQTLADAPRTETELRDFLGPAGLEQLMSIIRDKENLETLPHLESRFRAQYGFEDSIAETLKDAGLLETMTNYMRARQIVSELKIKPEKMVALIQTYGHLDLRTPETHALYWATLGREHSPGGVQIDCQRMITQSLKDGFMRGKLIFLDPDDQSTYQFTPNVALVDAARQAYLESAADHPNNRSFMSGYENFLKDAVVTVYMFNKEGKARELYKELRTRFSSERYLKTLDEFIIHEVSEDVENKSHDHILSIVQGYIVRSYVVLAHGDYEYSTGLINIANAIHEKYRRDVDRREDGQAEFDDIKDFVREEARRLPPFEDVVRQMRQQCLDNFPPLLRDQLQYQIFQLQAEKEREEEREKERESQL